VSRQRAFTLIELLVALAIFALMSAFAYRGLAVLLESRESLERDSRKWRDVALFVGRFERDVQAVLDRPATGASGVPMGAITSQLDLAGAGAGGLALTRSGAALYGNELAAPQRVGYRLAENRVDRLAWPGLDAGREPKPSRPRSCGTCAPSPSGFSTGPSSGDATGRRRLRRACRSPWK
jgi:general secretion pathway protein J